MSEAYDLVVVGSYVQDHAWLTDRFPVTGETRRANGFSTGPGGKGFNQAIAAHRQGARTVFVGAIGDDHLGRVAQAFAREQGLPCRWQVAAGAATAASSIVVDDSGCNQIVVALGANEHLDPASLADPSLALDRASLLVLQLENNLDAIAAAVAAAAAAGVPVLLNPAPVHPALDADLLRQVALLTPNESEFALLVERFAGTRIEAEKVAGLSDDALHVYARKLGVATVVITLGARGCFVSHAAGSRFAGGDHDRYRVAGEAVEAIDSTGAGDAFNGALAAALLRLGQAPFRSAVEHANRSAALATERVGTAVAMATVAEVRDRFGSD